MTPSRATTPTHGEPRAAGHEADVPGAVLLLAVLVDDRAGRRRRPAMANPAAAPRAPETTRVPMNRSTAGLTVMATSTVTATVAAATRPISARIGMPDSTSAPEGDDDRGAGEHDGAAGGRHGARDRLALVHRRAGCCRGAG